MQEFIISPEWRSSPLASSLGSIFETIDEDDDNMITFQEFLKAFCPLADTQDIANMDKFIQSLKQAAKIEKEEAHRDMSLSDEALAEINHLFSIIDVDRNGFVSIQELADKISSKEGFISAQDIEMIVSRYSSVDKKELTREDFVEVCREYFSYNSDDFLIREVLSYNKKERFTPHQAHDRHSSKTKPKSVADNRSTFAEHSLLL
mmetsp:Transcript_4616/g.8706  ORF Transcript_4616/g.8706 Transcript_4616/m.8706 type:complete len:205 (+) Transcript_4616:284-898(+)